MTKKRCTYHVRSINTQSHRCHPVTAMLKARSSQKRNAFAACADLALPCLLLPLMARVAHRQLRGEFTITRRTRLAEKRPRAGAGPIRLVPEWFVVVLVHSFVVRAAAPVPVRRSTELRSAFKLILRDVDVIAAKLS
jgi:hypothetical protein